MFNTLKEFEQYLGYEINFMPTKSGKSYWSIIPWSCEEGVAIVTMKQAMFKKAKLAKDTVLYCYLKNEDGRVFINLTDLDPQRIVADDMIK